jgi:hypothetical protein
MTHSHAKPPCSPPSAVLIAQLPSERPNVPGFRVFVRVAVAVRVADAVAVPSGVGVSVGVCVPVWVTVPVGVAVGVGESVDVGSGDGVGGGTALRKMVRVPLSRLAITTSSFVSPSKSATVSATGALPVSFGSSSSNGDSVSSS